MHNKASKVINKLSSFYKIEIKVLNATSSSKPLVVGRTTEISNLFLSLESEKSITVLKGEAGIGKTALLNEFYDKLRFAKRDNYFVGYFDKNKELRSAGLIYPFITVLESLLDWISKTLAATDKIKETMSRMEKAFVKFIKEKGTEISGALLQDLAEKIGLKETLKISKEFLKTFKEQRSATMLADTYITENKTEVVSSYIDIFNILRTEFQEHLFILIFDQFENVGKASIDFLIDFLKNLPTMCHVIISFRSAEEVSNENRRKITLHTFRRFVKTTISDLGYADYSEWYIGHAGSTYWRKKDNEKAEIFRKIEPYLTFLNVPQLERQGADLQTKIEELQLINRSLRENDKVKEDALSHLSDQLLVLSERIQQLERKQML